MPPKAECIEGDGALALGDHFGDGFTDRGRVFEAVA